MQILRSRCNKLFLTSAIALLLVSCGGESTDGNGGILDDAGGGTIIGTGIQLDGTASSVRTFASNSIEVKSQTGEKFAAQTNNTGRFILSDVSGEGPYLLRANMGNNDYLYSIAHKTTGDTVTQNIHSYTDAAARNWFASNGYDIDSAFANDNAITTLPTEQTLSDIENRLAAIVSDVLVEYDLFSTDLTTISYDANNTGVDLFLKSNPVLINNGSITILITDPNPDSRIITQATSEIALSTDLTLDDVVPPNAPTSLRALAASMNEIVIVWNAAVDNIGVTAYQVFRDSELIATTPFPVYTDTDVLSSQQYDYTIVAIDSSGNSSAPSISALSNAFIQTDTVAPPTPMLVLLEPGINSIEVTWSQTDIFDVAAFNIYRSGDAEFAGTTLRVTSTLVNDVTVLSGSQYCYQVSAVDVSGNESGLSATQCAVTSGSIVSTPVFTPTSSDFLAPTVDVSGLNCTEEIPRTVNSDTIITAGCYLAPSGINVSSTANLTLDAGVVIKFGSNTQLAVSNNASLTAIGTAISPIVLSSAEPSRGYWAGIRFSYSNSIENQLNFVQVEYAGSSSSRPANIYATNLLSNTARVSISNTTVRYGAGYGFYFSGNINLDKFEGNLMVENDAPIIISPDTASAINGSSRYTGNTKDEVVLSDTDIDGITTLAKLDVPYSTSSIRLDNSLTIEPGVTILFEGDDSFLVSDDAVLKALGTVSEPIIFTAKGAVRGYWKGIIFATGNNEANEIEHAIIEYAETALTVSSSAFNRSGRLSANHLILRESLDDGFNIGTSSNLVQFDNITSTLNGRAGQVSANSAHLLGANANFIGNDIDQIHIDTVNIERDVTWLDHGVPYLVDSLRIDAMLTLSAGTTFLMEPNGELRVGTDGILSAIGTAQNPILITGQEAIPGYWESINFVNSLSPNNRLEHVVVEYGGSHSRQSGGNITIACNINQPSRLSLENVSLNFSRDWGIFASTTGCELTLGENVTYMGNALGNLNLTP